jgi:hypothetical protein
VRKSLASTLFEMRLFDESLILYEEALEWTRRYVNEDDAEVAKAYLRLARLYTD